MNILVVYATYSSGTQTASQTVVDTLKNLNHAVTLKNASEIEPEDFEAYDLTVMGSPSWKINGKEGQPHEYFVALMEKVKGKLFENKSFAIFGLGHSPHYALFCGAVDHLEEMVRTMKGKLVVPSLRIDGFYFDQEKNEALLAKWAEDIAKNAA